jgi:hypothetical protein
MSRRILAAWGDTCAQFGQTLPIQQGAFMLLNGGGAGASAHFHDLSGALDIGVSNLTESERLRFIKVARDIGWAAWIRDMSPEHGGLSLHAHLALLGEGNVFSGLRTQMKRYEAGGAGSDGLKGGDGFDYHDRPNPIPRFDYRAWRRRQETDMQLSDQLTLSEATADALGRAPGTKITINGLLQTTARLAALAERQAKQAVAKAKELEQKIDALPGG